MPSTYYGNLLPPTTLWTRLVATESPQAGIMAIRQLGNCELMNTACICAPLTSCLRLSDSGMHVGLAYEVFADEGLRLDGGCCRSFFVLPKILRFGRDHKSTTSILRTYFAILAFADITHVRQFINGSYRFPIIDNCRATQIVATLIDLGPARWHLRSWNMLAHGNTTLVVGLFIFRMWYFAYSANLPGILLKAKST